MGTCLGCPWLRRRADVRSDSIIQDDESFASTKVRTPWGRPAKLTLRNKSKHDVSYWVVQENRLRIKAYREHVERTMNAHAKVGDTGGAISAGVGKEEGKTTQMEAEDYVLTRDQRMGKKNATQPTEVQFPDGCKELRVYGYFKQEDGVWTLYKEKVYSIGRYRTDYSLTAVNSSIAPYIRTVTA